MDAPEQIERNAPKRSPGDIIVAVMFALLLLVPGALALTGHAGADTAFQLETERRRPLIAPPPTAGALATGGWERDIERQIADAFPLRRTLIEGYDYAMYAWLGDIRSDNVILGRDGWLFLAAEEREYLDGKPDDAALAHLADLYATRSAWCAQHGMRYVYLVVPNKSTVYAQFLPVTQGRVVPAAADRLIIMLNARRVRTIDLRPALIAAAQRGEVFSHGDTHWNDAGAYAGYRAVVAALRDAGVREAIPPSSIRPRTEDGNGDLLSLGGIAGHVRNAWIHYDFPKRAHEIAVPSYTNDPDGAAFLRQAAVVDDPSLPVAVVFGDSFADQLREFLDESFRRTVVLHHVLVTDPQFDRRILLAEKPDVVIQELVERSLTFGAQFK